MALAFDVLLWGATGFTGELVCEYVAQTYLSDTSSKVKFAIGGRSKDKLEQLRARVAESSGAAFKVLIPVFLDLGSMRLLVC